MSDLERIETEWNAKHGVLTQPLWDELHRLRTALAAANTRIAEPEARETHRADKLWAECEGLHASIASANVRVKELEALAQTRLRHLENAVGKVAEGNARIAELEATAKPEEPPKELVDWINTVLAEYSKLINVNPELTSILYDVDLLPEQVSTVLRVNPRAAAPNVSRMSAICELWKRGGDTTARIAELKSQNAALVMQNAGLGGRVAACEALLEEASGDTERMSAVIEAMDDALAKMEGAVAGFPSISVAWKYTDIIRAARATKNALGIEQ